MTITVAWSTELENRRSSKRVEDTSKKMEENNFKMRNNIEKQIAEITKDLKEVRWKRAIRI